MVCIAGIMGKKELWAHSTLEMLFWKRKYLNWISVMGDVWRGRHDSKIARVREGMAKASWDEHRGGPTGIERSLRSECVCCGGSGRWQGKGVRMGWLEKQWAKMITDWVDDLERLGQHSPGGFWQSLPGKEGWWIFWVETVGNLERQQWPVDKLPFKGKCGSSSTRR